MSSSSSNLSSTNNKIVTLSLAVAVLAIAVLGVVAYAATTANQRQAVQADTAITTTTTTPGGGTPSTISVAGVGIINIQPDEVLLQLGVTNQGSNATQVLTKNSQIMTTAISAIEAVPGVNSSDVQTQQFSFGPTYSYNQVNGTNTISGYQASNQIQVTLQGNETSQLDAVINAGFNAGANEIQSVGYTMSNSLQAQVKQEALQAAVADANGTASTLAQSEHVKITGIQSVVLVSEAYPPYFQNTYNMVEATTMAAGAASINVPVSPGQGQYTLQVEVTYLIGQ